jgi:4,5-dihydroxyphthalate decarboxylase
VTLRVLRCALGRTPRTEALFAGGITSDLLRFEFENFPTINRAFAPMVREKRFDVSELAIATFLQAKAYGKTLVLLPVVVSARFQQSALLCRADSDIAGPADLSGRRVGVRAYSQTTGMWLRGILAEEYGVDPRTIRWVSFEDAHVAEARDPAWCERAAPGADLMEMLRAGELDAVIVGSDLPDMTGLRTVFPDPKADADRFWQRHRFVPVNHMVAVSGALAASRPDVVVELVRLFGLAKAALPPPADGRDPYPAGRAALRPAVELAARTMMEQGMLPHPVEWGAVWEGLPAEIA